jgi:hypothetical protein
MRCSERLFDFLKNKFVNQGYIILEQILWFFESGDVKLKNLRENHQGLVPFLISAHH